MLRIRRATALDNYTVRLTLTSGEIVERDLTAVLWGPVFEPLRLHPDTSAPYLSKAAQSCGLVGWTSTPTR